MGVEPTSLAWKARVLADIRMVQNGGCLTTSTLIELDSFFNQPLNASDISQLSAKLMVVYLILSHTP